MRNEQSVGITRRRLLGDAALASVGLAASLLPPSVRRALAAAPSLSTLDQIKHVVLLMQENRSFDHYFGTLAGVRGFDDPEALRLPDGRNVFHQPDALHPDGYLLPFHLDTLTTGAQKIPSTSHAWSVQHDSWNSGKMDRWLPAHREADGVNGPFVMGYHKRHDIPFQFALAESFTICDAYFCSVFGPTWPNRLYWMTGTSGADHEYGEAVIDNSLPRGPYTWTTYAERLESAGVSWKVYQQKDNYGCNVLENFRAFQESPADSPLRVKGMTVGSADQFEHDARNDRLPTVSWIIPTSHESEHPDYLPAAGAAFVAGKIDAIASNPDVWAKTVFILNYDENDGLFDHVPPPTPPPRTPFEFAHGLPIGGGFRVPCIIVSPWTAGGWVCNETFDHTSVLQLLEKVTGVSEPNISDWRRQTFGDLTAAFRLEDIPGKRPVLPDAKNALEAVRADLARLPAPQPPSGRQSAPIQEAGVRKRAAAPE